MNTLMMHSTCALIALMLVSCSKNHDNPDLQPVLRTISVTVDDLPTVGARDLADRQQITRALVGHMTSYGIPAVGFVNENKLGGTHPEPDEIALLEKWVAAGLELANHTYSHMDFTENDLVDFTADIVLGETITRPLMQKYDMELRWFRHPYLYVGDDNEKRLLLEKFLDEHGYRIAPITIDNADWYYNRAYNRAWEYGDTETMALVADDYIRYMEAVIGYTEQFSSDVLGSELPQILIIHANRLNADHFHRIADMILARGYKFIKLDEALRNHDYVSSDGLVEPTGVNWLQEKWIATGNQPRYRPPIPEWIDVLVTTGHIKSTM